MKKIIVLPPKVYAKIAAGEVIERPFSVVKELVENSLDAEASEIKIELLEGGKNLIKVTDNGQGMSREDALLCFERHSTSKISTEDDLSGISTLGFRGEALPSISAVSQLILKTSEKDDWPGTLIERHGEKVIRVSDIGFPQGTSVEVRNLFFNLPARQKFLRSPRAELSVIVKYLTRVCLAFPQIKFSLVHNQRVVFNYPPVRSLKERIFQIYGRAILERLLEVDYQQKEMGLYGYASFPPSGRSDRSHQFFFVNKRPVKDKLLQAALNQTYRGFLEKDSFAEAFLFLSCPCSEIDVNVHPTKAEVRFKDSQLIFQVVQRGIKQAMLRSQGIKEIYPASEENRKTKSIQEESTFTPALIRGRKPENKQEIIFPLKEREESIYPDVLGQYLNTYIVAADEEGIFIIDQHNAHERVLYEEYEEIDKDHQWPRRLALFPVVFDLSPSQLLSYEQNRELLEEVGYRLEEMGGRSFILKEFPDIFKEEEAQQAFISFLEESEKEELDKRKKKLLATLACKTAIKAGEVLTQAKMHYLVEKLFQTSNKSLCPHGRPIVVKIGRKEIEKGLKRG
ncbi:MAG: DNA mismatch repair endonuclease MutL [Candidatus Aminicenantales bacterium]